MGTICFREQRVNVATLDEMLTDGLVTPTATVSVEPEAVLGDVLEVSSGDLHAF